MLDTVTVNLQYTMQQQRNNQLLSPLIYSVKTINVMTLPIAMMISVKLRLVSDVSN